MNNLSYIIVFFLFVGVAWVGHTKVNELEQDRVAKEQLLIEEEEDRLQLMLETKAMEDWYVDGIVHDGKPEEAIYETILKANATDAEGDEISYKWVQVAGLDAPLVKLSSDDKPTVYFNAPAGKYTFELTVTDNYGDSSTETQIIVINDEPNTAPSAVIEVSEGPQPKDPFDGDVEQIKAFQTKNGLEADGKWGPDTKEAYENPKQESIEKTPNKD
tara:strand:- start:166 stop:813 length:648 start_codon:yes stop_codon:yes gene_type:complete